MLSSYSIIRTETCRSVFSVVICKFYICAVVGVIIEYLSHHCFVSEGHSEMSTTDINSSILTCHIVTNIRHKLQINPDLFT